RRVVELLALADPADSFHKKTVSAAVGGGVACVAGGIATITGLILAPFTFGTSTIVTAVGISVATAGSITSATANITDAVQSKMDRKKVEKMIQDYQNEIDDITDCLEFMQNLTLCLWEGINTLQEWNLKEYFESLANSRLQRNIKHVVKEGGRTGKALMINTEKLISTVKVLAVAGGAAQAAKAISVTTGVVSALFLALDVFFLAKDSNELRKGAKTKFASKIREVCCELQKTMDGIEVEEYDKQGEVEDDHQDPIKLAQLEQELDQLEEKLERMVHK
ncbi:apolipoprotein L3-like, partial [Triplophysa dalaica]|uniref:apolipoprotein L3-like n=1 Tax=Triplophysa dalaica TaxID=1582913 RepID=UPI0024DF43E8